VRADREQKSSEVTAGDFGLAAGDHQLRGRHLEFGPSKSKHGAGETLQMIGFGGSGLFVMPAVSARRLKMRH
jgi:hypothetical protein